MKEGVSKFPGLRDCDWHSAPECRPKLEWSQSEEEALSSLYNHWIANDDKAIPEKYSFRKYKMRIETQIRREYPH